MRRLSTLLFLYFTFTISNANEGFTLSSALLNPKDSVLQKITDIDKRLKEFTRKDTLGGYSTPRKIETSSYFNLRTIDNQPQRNREGLIVVSLEYEPFLSYINFVDTIIFDQAILPVIFDGKLLSNKIDFRNEELTLSKFDTTSLINKDSIVSPQLYQYKNKADDSYRLIDKDSTYYSSIWNTMRTQSIRQQYYVTHPERIKLNALNFDETTLVKEKVETRNPFKSLVTAEDAIKIETPDVEKLKVKQVYWKKWGQHDLKFSQKSYSDNWGPKTNNSFYIQNYHKFSARFRKNKIEFNHWIEWRLNIQSVSIPSEEKQKNPDYNSLLINDDWIKTYNKLGLDAFVKKWSYTFTLDIKTPVFNKYPQNNKTNRLAGLFSPLEVNFGLGVTYAHNWTSKTTKGRNMNFSIDAAPISINMRHVGSDKVYKHNKYGVVYDANSNKVGERRYTKTDLGSTINASLVYKFNDYTSINSRFKYFSNYEKAYAECENTLRFRLNRYLETSFYLYMKFDDSMGEDRKDKTWGYFSYNEVLEFGLSYSW